MSVTHSYRFTPEAPYQFDYFLERVQNSSNTYLYSFTLERLSRALLLDNHPVLVHVSAEQPHETGTASITLDVQNAKDQQQADEAAALWRHMLSADRSLLPFYEKMVDDPVMRGLTERFSGMHLLLEPNSFEAMVLSIIGQQVNLTFAENLKRSLVELCGETLSVDGEQHYAFPGPERIARLSYDDLRAHKYSQRKAEYVIDFARGVASGEIDLAALDRMSNEEAIDSLVKLRGIGRWTAECVLLFGLGRPDLLPAADIGLRNALQHFYALDHQPTEAEVREMARAWQGYESYATYYLWAGLGVVKAEQKLQKKRKVNGK